MIILNKYGKEHPITFETANYLENGNLYVGMVTHEEGYPEPWSDLTVNLSVPCEPNCAFIDTNNNGNEIIDWLIKNKLGHLTNRIKGSGFCWYLEFEFDMEELMKHIINKDDFYENEYIPSSTYGDYSPSNPWDAPGMSVRDFI